MENNIVHVLVRGEAYEGSTVIAVFATEAAARARAEELIAEDAADGGYSYRADPPGPNGELAWTDGGSYYEIQRFTLGA